jgi:hypothetical protein
MRQKPLDGGWPTSAREYDALSWIVSRENKEGAPLLAIFEKWGAVLPAVTALTLQCGSNQRTRKA